MKSKWVLAILFVILWSGITASSSIAKEVSLPTRMAAYDGKTFTGFQDPEYLSYDQALRKYLVKLLINDLGLSLIPKSILGLTS